MMPWNIIMIITNFQSKKAMKQRKRIVISDNTNTQVKIALLAYLEVLHLLNKMCLRNRNGR